MHARLALQCDGAAEQELGGAAAAAALGLDGHRGFAAAQDHAGLAERRVAARHRARQRGVHLADLARFAFDLVAQNVRLDARRACQRRSRLQRLLRRGDQVHGVAFEARVARLGRLECAALQATQRGIGNGDGVAVQDRQRVGAGARIGHGGAAGDDFGRIAGHIRNQQRDHLRRRAHGGQPTALDRGQMLAHAVHLVDGRAAAQQGLGDGLLVLQTQAVGGQRQQRRAAAGDQAQHQVVGTQPLGEPGDSLRRRQTRSIGHGVCRFCHFDAPGVGFVGRRHMAVASDHQAADRRGPGPQRIDRRCHRAAGLAGTDHQRASARGRRQEGGGVVGRQGARHRRVVQGAKKLARPSLRRQVAHAVGSVWCLNCSRRRFLSIFPVAPSGMESTKTTSSGVHHLAMRPS